MALCCRVPCACSEAVAISMSSVYTDKHTCMHTCTHTYMHAYIHRHIHTIYIYICIHTYIHTCMHACMHTCKAQTKIRRGSGSCMRVPNEGFPKEHIAGPNPHWLMLRSGIAFSSLRVWCSVVKVLLRCLGELLRPVSIKELEHFLKFNSRRLD